MNPAPNASGTVLESADLEHTAVEISSGAAGRDRQRSPGFPEEPFRALATAGLLALPVPRPLGGGERHASFGEEWRVLRRVAAADGSVGRILDGHFNGVERIAVLAPEPLRSRELAKIASGELRLGVWGADPIPGEGPPAASSKRERGTRSRA